MGKTIRTLFLILLFNGMAVYGVHAQSEDAVAGSDEETTSNNEIDEPETTTQNESDTPESFIPSEDISEDLSVSFPIDI